MEQDRLSSGTVAVALRIWAQVVRGPGPGVSHEKWCEFPFEQREILERALCRLPPRAARELRELVRPLDEIYLANTSNDPFAARGDPWWRRRI
ncbi:hypothetical protein [Kutzneria kofuensis]|uniref:Uncharacterized protein n=1 Tax=Kutzneria kofuensis TaxID=103725 RepID=A0A7W9KAN8_9PSEU|nr:hypothetical protein [Kutzneria kofuensis]MBB5889109.1 hypothetical protein [Kutzneria kofuensis]